MTEQETRFQAAINEVVLQRDMAQARCANLAGDLAVAHATIAEHSAKPAEGVAAKDAGLALVELLENKSKVAELRAEVAEKLAQADELEEV